MYDNNNNDIFIYSRIKVDKIETQNKINRF